MKKKIQNFEIFENVEISEILRFSISTFSKKNEHKRNEFSKYFLFQENIDA